MKEFEEFTDKLLGEKGGETIQQAKNVIASLYNVLGKASELVNAVEHARDTMGEGYAKGRSLFSAETLKKVKGVYETLKKLGILGVLDGMARK